MQICWQSCLLPSHWVQAKGSLVNAFLVLLSCYFLIHVIFPGVHLGAENQARKVSQLWLL